MLVGGYIKGKKMAEEAVRANFPDGGVVLKPGVIYGNRCDEAGSMPRVGLPKAELGSWVSRSDVSPSDELGCFCPDSNKQVDCGL